MCGIVAQHGGDDVADLERMLRRLHHRGPDERGSKRLGHGWLGHTRLSIVDLAHGRQPLANAAGDAWLVGNGDIYNHAQVRAEIGDEGFLTMSDNEVGLYLMEHDSVDALAQPLRSKEELAYYRVWRAHLTGVSAERTLSRFARA